MQIVGLQGRKVIEVQSEVKGKVDKLGRMQQKRQFLNEELALVCA